jgi:hypothetical protein
VGVFLRSLNSLWQVRLSVTTPGPMIEPYGVLVHRFMGSPKPKACITADQTTLSVEAERIF